MLANFDLILLIWPVIGLLAYPWVIRQQESIRDEYVMIVTGVQFALTLILFLVGLNQPAAQINREYVMELGMSFRLDGFRSIYSVIASFMFFVSALFSKEYFKDSTKDMNRYYFFYLMTFVGVVGVFISESLFTLFVFFEVMSIASFVWVIHDETEYARRAALQYLFVGIIGGMGLLIGLFMLNNQLGTLMISEFVPAVQAFQGNSWMLNWAVFFMAFGFAGKAGMFFLHFWLPVAHPTAPAPASALLSGILTKAGVFGILILSSYLMFDSQGFHTSLLVVGALGMFIGAFKALFSTNLKTILALSSVSQIGFITIGIGMIYFLGSHNAIAIRGVFLHMINHSLLKLLLFNLAGLIYAKTHTLDLNELRGYGRGKPILLISFLVGALSIGGFPMFSGFISKTLLHEAIVEHIWYFTSYSSEVFMFQLLEGLFIIAGGFTVAYMLKIFGVIFIEKHPTHQSNYEEGDMGDFHWTSKLGLVLTTVSVFLPGIVSGIFDFLADQAQGFMHAVPLDHAVNYFAWINIKGALISIAIGLIIYFFIIRPLLIVQVGGAEERVLVESDQLEGHLVESHPDSAQSQLTETYISPLPAWLDIYTILYKPLISVFLFLIRLVAQALGFIPTWFGQFFYRLVGSIGGLLNKPLELETRTQNKDDETGYNLAITSTLTLSLLGLGLGMVLIIMIVWLN